MMSGGKKILMEAFADVARSLAQGSRLELLEILGQGERSVEDLAARAGIPIANASQHLLHLHRAGLVTARREGKRRFYRLGSDAVVTLVAALRNVAERHHPESRQAIQSFFSSRDSLKPVARDELLTLLQHGSITVLDVRPVDEFSNGHLAGARSIPLVELEQRLGDLPIDQEVIAYCRGPWCMMSFEAVELLRSYGFKVRRLEDGFPELKTAGLPIEAPGLLL